MRFAWPRYLRRRGIPGPLLGIARSGFVEKAETSSRWLIIIAIAILIAAMVFLAHGRWPRGQALVLEDGAGRTLYSRPVEMGEVFTTGFTHSLAKSLVEEMYEVTAPDEFRLRETRYADFGAGLPHEETPGLRMEFGDGRIRLSGYDVKFGEVQIRVGHIANHYLLFADGRRVHLADLMRPGGMVRMTLRTFPRGFAWLSDITGK